MAWEKLWFMAPDLGLSSFSINHTLPPSNLSDSCLWREQQHIAKSCLGHCSGQGDVLSDILHGHIVASSNIRCFQGVSANQVMYDPPCLCLLFLSQVFTSPEGSGEPLHTVKSLRPTQPTIKLISDLFHLMLKDHTTLLQHFSGRHMAQTLGNTFLVDTLFVYQ